MCKPESQEYKKKQHTQIPAFPPLGGRIKNCCFVPHSTNRMNNSILSTHKAFLGCFLPAIYHSAWLQWEQEHMNEFAFFPFIPPYTHKYMQQYNCSNAVILPINLGQLYLHANLWTPRVLLENSRIGKERKWQPNDALMWTKATTRSLTRNLIRCVTASRKKCAEWTRKCRSDLELANLSRKLRTILAFTLRIWGLPAGWNCHCCLPFFPVLVESARIWQVIPMGEIV